MTTKAIHLISESVEVNLNEEDGFDSDRGVAPDADMLDLAAEYGVSAIGADSVLLDRRIDRARLSRLRLDTMTRERIRDIGFDPKDFPSAWHAEKALDAPIFYTRTCRECDADLVGLRVGVPAPCPRCGARHQIALEPRFIDRPVKIGEHWTDQGEPYDGPAFTVSATDARGNTQTMVIGGRDRKRFPLGLVSLGLVVLSLGGIGAAFAISKQSDLRPLVVLASGLSMLAGLTVCLLWMGRRNASAGSGPFAQHQTAEE